jgi:beta-galactosidase
VPPAPRTIAIPEFALNECCPLLEADLGHPVWSERPQPMEALGQAFGYILYRTYLKGPLHGELHIETLRDYAVVALDGAVVAHLDRRLRESKTLIESRGERVRLDILVENGGRINYGPDLPFERKGISGAVRFDDGELREWEIFTLPLTDPAAFDFKPRAAKAPALYRGTMHVESPSDTFLDCSQLGKGALWVNGRNAGRFWNIGPQYSLYVPGVWLRRGENDVIALDLFAREQYPLLRGMPDPLRK